MSWFPIFCFLSDFAQVLYRDTSWYYKQKVQNSVVIYCKMTSQLRYEWFEGLDFALILLKECVDMAI